MNLGYFFLLSLKEALRQPMYILTSLLFPAMFFWFFGVPNAKDEAGALLLLGSFSTFAILGVVLFQLAVHTSMDKASPWLQYVRTLPVTTLEFMLAKIGASFVLSLLAAGAVVLVAISETPLKTEALPWLPFVTALLLGGVPFAFMALTLGFLIKGKAILPAANMVYLPLSFAGGLWLPPSALPTAIQKISEYLPTRMYGEIVWAVLFKKTLPSASVKGLLIYTFVFLLSFLLATESGRQKCFGIFKWMNWQFFLKKVAENAKTTKSP